MKREIICKGVKNSDLYPELLNYSLDQILKAPPSRMEDTIRPSACYALPQCFFSFFSTGLVFTLSLKYAVVSETGDVANPCMFALIDGLFYFMFGHYRCLCPCLNSRSHHRQNIFLFVSIVDLRLLIML